MTAKIVCRLLDAQNKLLGWVEHYAVARGDGTLRSTDLVVIPIECAGVPVCVSLHWADVNVESRVPCPNTPVVFGELLAIFPADVPIVTLGIPPVWLPAVTVGRPVTIGIPVGTLGARPSGTFEVIGSPL